MSSHQRPLPLPGTCPATLDGRRCTRDAGHHGVHFDGRWHFNVRPPLPTTGAR